MPRYHSEHLKKQVSTDPPYSALPAIPAYHIVGKFGKFFNLAIWRSRKKSPN